MNQNTSAHPPFILFTSRGASANSANTKPKTIIVDLSEVNEIDGFYNSHSAPFQFPDYYGKNFNAWYDCMTDSSIIDTGCKSLVIEYVNTDTFWQFMTTDALKMTLASLIDVGVYWAIPSKDDQRFDDHESMLVKFVFRFASERALQIEYSRADTSLEYLSGTFLGIEQ